MKVKQFCKWLLMVKKWHYFALKSVRTTNGYHRPVIRLSRLYWRITSNNNGDFYCFSCLHSFHIDNGLKKHERLCDNHDYCHVKRSTEDNKILKYNNGEKSLKAPFTIIADLECLLIKEQSCQNNPKKIIYWEKRRPWTFRLLIEFNFFI